MSKTKRWLPLLVLPSLLAGCATTITNLTPQQQVRNPSGMYPVEAIWESRQHSIRKETLKPAVIVGLEAFSMQRTPLTLNRWETVVPVPPNQRFLNYQFKFDFEYDSIPIPRTDSRLSPVYQMEIVDK